MDTNLKNEEKKIDDISQNKNFLTKQKNLLSSSLAAILIIFIFASLSVASYIPFKNYFFSQQDDLQNYIESSTFVLTLTELTEYLYQSKIMKEDWHSTRHETLESIKYYISNKESSYSNIANVAGGKLEKEIEKSQFQLRAKLQGVKIKEIETSLGEKFNTSLFINNLNLERWNEASLSDKDNTNDLVVNSDIQMDSDHDEIEIIYFIPEDIGGYYDYLTHDFRQQHVIPKYLVLILVIGAISIFLLSLISYAIPYTDQENSVICKAYNKLFLELKIFLWLGFLGVSFLLGLATSSGSYYPYANKFNINYMIYEGNIYFFLLGIPITFALYLLIYLTIVYSKYIYYQGFKKGFIENSFMGKTGFSLIRKLRKSLGQLMSLDINRDPNRQVFIALAVNLFIVWIIIMSRDLGFILAIVWSIFIFKYMVEFMLQMKELHDASSQLAGGDFNINLNEETGILNPISKNLNNIKEGFQLAVDKEIKSQKMKTDLISNVSHDLKTPLTSIITYIDLLKDENLDKLSQKEYVDVLDRKSKRLNILIEDLFEASKASSGNIELNLEEIDIIALFRQTLGEMEEEIKKSNLQMRINIPDKKVICNLDGRRTYRIFENIMENILKYALENSRVYIDILDNNEEVTFIFKNISSYEMNFDASEITERFTRGDKSRNTEGSGLGLSIAKSFVDLQKGHLEVVIDGDLFKLILNFPKYNL